MFNVLFPLKYDRQSFLRKVFKISSKHQHKTFENVIRPIVLVHNLTVSVTKSIVRPTDNVVSVYRCIKNKFLCKYQLDPVPS